LCFGFAPYPNLAPLDDKNTWHSAYSLIDPNSEANYSVAMNSLEQTAKDLERLERQMRTLLEQIGKLREENQSLQTRQSTLVAERASLVAKNDEARTKVEGMIHRLKALEQV
jgi:cell division protein ZapB